MAAFGVLVFASYLFWLAWLALFKPDRAVVFLEMFASSAKAHVIEMGFRVLAGITLMGAAPRSAFGGLFTVFGAVLILTSLVLLVLPWHRHRAFARRVLPGVFSNLRLFGLGSFSLGIWLLLGLIPGVFSR